MASQLSMSESFQASAIFNEQLNKQFPQPATPTPEKRVRLVVQVLLVAALFGIEMCMAFEQIYMILLVRFMGSPLSISSMGGVMAGLTSVVLMPVFGCFIDGGPNPKARKIWFLLVGMSIFLLGNFLIMACGIIKVNQTGMFVNQLTINSSTNLQIPQIPSDELYTNSSSATPPNEYSADTRPPLSTTELEPVSETDVSDLPATAFMSIVGFALLDIGYDTSMSLTRAFVLHCVPQGQHTRLLLTATVVQSSAGVVFSFVGIFDFSDLLGSYFHVDGLAATAILFSSVLNVIVFATFMMTIVTGYLYDPDLPVHSMPESRGKRRRQISELSDEPGSGQDEDWNRKSGGRMPQQRPYVPDILHTEEGGAATKPLLLEDSLNLNYSSTSAATTTFFFDAKKNAKEPIVNRKIRHHSFGNATDPNDDGEGQTTDRDDDDYGALEKSADKNSGFRQSGYISETLSEQTQSMSLRRGANRDFQNSRLSHSPLAQAATARSISICPKISPRMAVLLCSTFFAMGSMLSYALYVSNALTVDIFHGDPDGLPGSEEKRLYEEGLQAAALGNTVLYVVYFVLSMNNKKLIDLIGEKFQYLVGSLLFILFSVVLFLTQSFAVYFLSVAAMGPYRSCVFTVLYVLANKFAYEDSQAEEDNSGGGRPKSSNMGQVLSLVGVLLPGHYVLLSAAMGPLMEVTGDVWVPLKYSAVTASASLAVFCLLFFIKKK